MVNELQRQRFILIKRQSRFIKLNEECKGNYVGRILSLQRRIKQLDEKIAEQNKPKFDLCFLVKLLHWRFNEKIF